MSSAGSRLLKVFLCHGTEDKVAVRSLRDRLRADGFDPWFDEDKLLPGQHWDLAIREAVRQSHAIIICLSRASVTKSGYVQKEIKYALHVADEQPEGSIFLIPIRLDDCNVPHQLSHLQWGNYFEGRNHQTLVATLRQRAFNLGIDPGRESEAVVQQNRETSEGKAACRLLAQECERSRKGGPLLAKAKLEYLFEHRHALNVDEDGWLLVVESALVNDDLSPWLGLMEDSVIWFSIKHVIRRSSLEAAVCAAALYLGHRACTNQADYCAFLLATLAHEYEPPVQEAILQGIADGSGTQSFFDEFMEPYMDSYMQAVQNDRTEEVIVKLTRHQPDWFRELVVQFYLRSLQTPRPIDSRTYRTLRLLSKLGEKSAIAPLKELHSRGFGGNEAEGERYLMEIETTLLALGADTSDLHKYWW